MTQIRLRSDVGSAWASANPTLAVGEVGISTVINRFKVGDGSTQWNSLPFQGINSTNMFLNGDFSVDAHQDLISWVVSGSGSTPTTNIKYAADRWRCEIEGTPTTNGTITRGLFRVQLIDVSNALGDGDNAVAALPITFPMKQFARTQTIWRGESMTRRTISQRVERGGVDVQGAYTLSFWARSKDSASRASWITPWFFLDGASGETTGTPVLLTTDWKRYSATVDIGSSIDGLFFEAGIKLPITPDVTWATAAGTSTDKITVATTVSGTPLVVKMANTAGLVAGAKIRLQGSASGTTDKILEGVINTVVANTSVSIDVSLISGSGTAEAWTVYVSMYAAGSVTPSRSSSIAVTVNTVASSITVNSYVLLRCRATPGNWMYGKVLSTTATSITIKTNDNDIEGNPITDAGGSAASGWDVNLNDFDVPIDLFGMQLEPDRGASQFHLATGHHVSEALACKRYFERVTLANMITVASTGTTMLGVIWYTEKYSNPTISYDLSSSLVAGSTTSGGSITTRVLSEVASSSASISNCRIRFTISGGTFFIGSAGYAQTVADVLAEI